MSTEHDDIKKFLARMASDQPEPGVKMKYNPKTRKFEKVSSYLPNRELQDIEPEDLQSFG